MNRDVNLLADIIREADSDIDAAGVSARLPELVRRRRRRHRITASAYAGIAVLAVATTVVVALNQPPRRDTAADLLDAPTVAEIYEPNRSVSVSAVRQGSVEAVVVVAGKKMDLEAYAPGVVPAAELAPWRARGTSITVNGRPGFFVVGQSPSKISGYFGMRQEPEPMPTIAWEYATGAWAFLGCLTCNPATALLSEAAAMVRLGPAAPITAPVRFGYLEDGFRLLRIDRLGVEGNGPFFTRADRPYQVAFRLGDPEQSGRSLTVLATPNNGTDWQGYWPTGSTPDQTINGHAVWWSDPYENVPPMNIAYVDFGSCHLTVEAAIHEDSIRIIENLETADCNDTATWWDARSLGLPAGSAQGRQMPLWLPGTEKPTPAENRPAEPARSRLLPPPHGGSAATTVIWPEVKPQLVTSLRRKRNQAVPQNSAA
jgi:hypothetical protein